MAYSSEQLKTELDRQFTLIWEMPFSFSFFVAIKEYVTLVRSHAILSDILDSNHAVWQKKYTKILAIESFTDKQRIEEIHKQGMLDAGYSFLKLLHVYHAINWLIERKDEDKDFQWHGTRHIFLRDMQRVQDKNVSVMEKDYINEFWSYREDFRHYLQQVHNSLMTALLVTTENIPKEAIATKTLITIDKQKGIYKGIDFMSAYQLEHGTKRETLILSLCKKDRVGIAEIQKETGQVPSMIIKEIKNINSIFRKKLLVADDLILSIPTGGYSLNKDRFDIELKQ
jgi:hypothetical protein